MHQSNRNRKNPGKLKNKPAEKSRLEDDINIPFANGPTADTTRPTNQVLAVLNNLISTIRTFFQTEGNKILVISFIYIPIYFFLMYFTFLQGEEEMKNVYGEPDEWLPMAVHSIVEITVIYYLFIFKIAIPLLQTRKVGRFLLRISVFYIVLFVYEYWVNFKWFITPAVRAGMTFSDFSIWHIFVDIIIFCIGFAVALLLEWNTKSKKHKELEKEKTAAELAAIKYQINPHFLFNSLSFIYSKAVTVNEEVARAVLLLSDIMRYALVREEDATGKVALGKEIEHLKNVIEINQLRYQNKLNIHYHENIESANIRIPPLILITLVENAFKHGDLSDPENPLIFQLEANRIKLHFYVCNKKKNGSKEISNGIGLSNVRQRLELMYGIRHTFEIKEDHQYYITNLTINL